MDTGNLLEKGDTSDSGQARECEQPIISAAKLAGETGGVSCNSISEGNSLFLMVMVIMFLIARVK